MSKKVLKSTILLAAGDMSGDVTSAVLNTQFIDNIGLQIRWTSSDAVGVITIEVSADNIQFDALTFDPALAQPDSDSSSFAVTVKQTPFPYLRVSYAAGSGSGALSVIASGKEV